VSVAPQEPEDGGFMACSRPHLPHTGLPVRRAGRCWAKSLATDIGLGGKERGLLANLSDASAQFDTSCSPGARWSAPVNRAVSEAVKSRAKSTPVGAMFSVI